MAKVSNIELGLIIFSISMIFVSGLLWCFCCGTCVGRSLLRQTPLSRWTRDNRGNTRWQDHIPLDSTSEEQWHIWNEEDEDSEHETIW
ncbi:uncharacterized protein BX664DRAFT_349640 [Halteromyces radiatus]|uniref:uncharacterized protein n=1 Tax=Halteromyces radiatus TaxID=101107 RepID=UPI00221EAF3D|nr:uncharacterized protein BX664DRAFT_349640 [Halteromyces radiatus]KAI8089244.1 hypothetical protein BX664DRAFT_349640 [Halteromyces radiatus]